jgi:hypothetical protein
MPRAEMLSRMSSRELSEWIAFDRIEPLPEPWRQTGLLAALTYNAHFSGSRKGPSDFIPAARRPDPEIQTAEEAMARMSGLRAAMAHQGD